MVKLILIGCARAFSQTGCNTKNSPVDRHPITSTGHGWERKTCRLNSPVIFEHSSHTSYSTCTDQVKGVLIAACLKIIQRISDLLRFGNSILIICFDISVSCQLFGCPLIPLLMPLCPSTNIGQVMLFYFHETPIVIQWISVTP